tara:strand:- start:1096 stop:1284 length:189 start_codon:yes stop_codon:yes gene_type:complete
MPFKVVKKGNKYRLWKIKERKYAKASFNSKASAVSQAKNWMKYRKEKPIVKGNFIITKGYKY